MKHNNKSGFSLGTILTLCLTAAVTVGCLFLFGKIRGGNPDVRMDAQRVIGVVHTVIQGATEAPAPQSTVRTVTVTLAPVTAAPFTAQPQPQATSAPAYPQGQSYSFSLTAGGLLSFQSDISDTVYNKAEKAADYRAIVSPLSAKVYADMNLVTFPQLLNTSDHKYGDALAPESAADAIRLLGVDEVVLGCEHILDQGAQGAQDTVRALNARGLMCEGVNASGASQNRVLQLNGGAVAVLSYTDVLTAKSKNALKQDGALLRPFDLDTVRQDISLVRGQGARCVVVCLYWGRADAASITNAQRSTAQALAQMGADVILGVRPSRVLPMEIISCTGEDGRPRQAFVAYSLGTLLSESREGYDISGCLLHLNIAVDAQGKVTFSSAEYTPTYIWRQSVNGKTQYRILCSADPAPEEMTSQQKEVMQRALNRIQTTLADSPVTQRK